MRNISFLELCDFIKAHKGSKVALSFHTIGDRDGVGSAVALSEYFGNATVVTPDFITNNAKRMLSYLNLQGIVHTEFPKDAEAIIIMDTNNLFALGKHEAELKDFKGEILFIDHHAPREGLNDSVRIFNDESYNSTASIVYAAMKKVGMEIKRETAILLLNGIIADSADLQNAFPETFRQVAELLEIAKVDFSFFSDFVNKSIPVRNKYQVLRDIFEARTEVLGDYLLIYGRATEHANVAADTAIRLDADIALFWVTSNTEASISARMRSPLDKELSINLGMLMHDIGPMVGGNGGGHPCAAGAYGSKREAAQEAGEEAIRRIKEKIASAMHK